MNESAVTKKLAEGLLDATHTASGYISPITRKAVAAVLRELADQGMAKKPADVLAMADYLDPDEGEAAA